MSMSTIKTILFDSNDQNKFIHNTNEVQIDTNGATLKKITSLLPNETLMATARDGSDADRGIDLTATALNGAVLSTFNGEQYYDISGVVSAKSWVFDGSNFPATQQVTVSMKLIAKYNGTPATNRYIWSANGIGNANNIVIFHQATGNIQIRINNNAGSLLSVINFGGINFTQNQEYDLELGMNFDIANGINLFIDGVPQTPTGSNTSLTTRGAVDTFALGINTGPNSSDYLIRDVNIHNNIQHTADFSGEIPRIAQLYPYESIIEPTDASLAEGFFSLDADVDNPSGSSVNYVLKIENQCYWWDGLALVSSNQSLAESNPRADWNLSPVVDAVTAFIASGARITFLPILVSDGVVPPVIISTTTSYDFFALPVSCVQCTVYGFITDNCVDITSGTVTFSVSEPVTAQGNVVSFNDEVPVRITGGTDQGFFEYGIIIPDVGNEFEVDVLAEWTDNNGDDWVYRKKIVVPNQISANLVDIIVEE